MTIEGSDWAVSPSPDPWIAIETLITRLPPGGGNEAPLAPKEKITLKEVIDVYTINGAKRWGHADAAGLLTAGRDADMIVLDRDPFAIPATELHNVKVKTTYIAGEAVYTLRAPQVAQR